MTSSFRTVESQGYSSAAASFASLFAPLAHHLFPDGCPRDALESEWPLRADRSIVPVKAAMASLQKQIQGHYTSVQLDCLAAAAARAVQAPSLLMTNFKTLLKCLRPETRDSVLSEDSLKQLLLVRLDMEDRAALYKLLLLALRHDFLLAGGASSLEPYYPLFFHHCQYIPEAVHLLLFLTQPKHAAGFRARRLEKWYEKIPCVYMLLDLYSKLNPEQCALPPSHPRDGNGDASVPPSPRLLLLKWTKAERTWEEEVVSHLTMGLETSRAPKRPRKELEQGQHHQWWGQSTKASELLIGLDLVSQIMVSDERMMHLRAVLPYMLYEEWYQSVVAASNREGGTQNEDDDEEDEEEEMSSHEDQNSNDHKTFGRKRAPVADYGARTNVVKALAIFTHGIGRLLPEVSSFLLHDILPIWDGTDEWGLPLCYDLLPHVAVGSKEMVLVQSHLEPFLRYGSPRLVYCILSGLVRQWIHENNAATRALLKDWVMMEMKRCFIGGRSSAHTLLCLAVLDVYRSVRSKTKLLPAQIMVYTLFLSSRTSVVLDQLCGLLVEYRSLLMTTNKRHQARIDFFNSIIWDMCSLLWKRSIVPNEKVSKLFCTKEDLPPILLEHPQSLSLMQIPALVGYYREGSFSRPKYVDFLKSRGLTGLHTFLVTFVGALADREALRRERREAADSADATHVK